MSEGRYAYSGDPSLEPLIARALARVVDPEMSLDIVGLGLVYAVEAQPGKVRLRITMTSAACPVSELIVSEIDHEVKEALGRSTDVLVTLVWEPPWTPEMMSERARAALDW